MTGTIFVIISIIILFIFVYRINRGESVYKYVLTKTSDIYEKYYQADGITLERIIDYNTSEELVIGKVEKMEDFSRVLKDTYYHVDGKNIKRVIFYPNRYIFGWCSSYIVFIFL